MLRSLNCMTLIGAAFVSTASAPGKPHKWHSIENTDQCVDDNSMRDAGRIVTWTQDFCPSDRRHGRPTRIKVDCSQKDYERVGWKVFLLTGEKGSATRWPAHSPIIEWVCFPGIGFL